MFAHAAGAFGQESATPQEPGPGAVLVLRPPALVLVPHRPVFVSNGGESAGAATASIDAASLTPDLSCRTLGGCRINRKLGQGCMGQVYEGRHLLLDRPVAIKILPPELCESEERRARLRQEARIAAALRHPNIVQIYDFGEDGGTLYLIMEFIDGTSLKGRLNHLRAAGAAMPAAEAIGIAGQLAGALAYAHRRGASHRDLKPANILINESGQAIIVDFGLALMRGAPRLTEPGTVWGSPAYIAPEQLGETPRVDHRSDLYSLGVVLYEMVTGHPPFRADAIMEVLWQQANVSPRPPRDLAPHIPTELEVIILRTLAKRPQDRFADAQALADALAAIEV